jgi:molecular chaperone HtpG
MVEVEVEDDSVVDVAVADTEVAVADTEVADTEVAVADTEVADTEVDTEVDVADTSVAIDMPDNPQDDNVNVEDVDTESETDENNKLDKPTKPTVLVEKWEKVNYEPIWTKSPKDITIQEYNDFYKTTTSESDPDAHIHFTIEGQNEFTGLLYIPSKASQDVFDQKTQNIKLYVKKVLITDNCENLCPEWLKFVKGIVDSNDLPLNASRELLQESKLLKQISTYLVKKTIEMIRDISADEEKFKKFYENFSKNIKFGIYKESESNRTKLIEFLRFTTSTGEFVSFSDYVARMKEG